MKGSEILQKILDNPIGIKFTDISKSVYEIIKIDRGGYIIRTLQEGEKYPQVTDGPSPPILKAEWYSYCVEQKDGTHRFNKQYMTNICMRGYIDLI